MARLSGDNGRVYLGIANSAATPEPLPFIAKWSLKFNTDKYDVTAMGDGQKIYVSGLRDATGSFSGWYDDSTNQTYSAAVDGAPRKFYLYPSADTTKYYFGQILADMNIDGGTGGGIAMSADWAAYSTITRV
jgi:hypothetical protein